MERNRNSSNSLGPRHDATSRVQKPEPAADRMAALKARVAAAIGSSKAKGGLNVGLHPALEDLGQWKPSGKSQDPGSASGSARFQGDSAKSSGKKKQLGISSLSTDANRSNPYYDANAPGHGAAGRQRESRQLIFNQKGKYIQQANALRRQAALEAMKKRIAEQTRKVGIDEDLDLEKNFVVEAPPDIEWWDEALVEGKNYDDIDDPKTLKIVSPDSIITVYIQHPVAIEPPQDRHIPPPKPMYLTPKEQKKLRRQRRMVDLKEKQAKIRLGLEPAPPPKVKKGNLMRVLGEEALQDPTAVEARVNREIAERHQEHLQANEDRKLTKEERHQKIVANREKDAQKGIHVLVLKIGSLANGQHRYKIAVNAEQHGLTGVCIMHPSFNLVVVEGGEYSIGKYKKLMLDRIDWTENVPSREKEDTKGTVRDWLKAEDEKGMLRDMSLNKCTLVFEGEAKGRAFRKWGSRVCETDSEARDVLARTKMESFWVLAKNLQGNAV
ncbi:pre-mRNA processing factor 3-domain-containing protein [Phialemonium atrogriseum]|uniref:Pre-mRNA processing factor 3-domain-containing protein n=1 Tax=Phialemonium atrogriseum TaxID=1093897 RepID=A0AAJ0CAJ0_9PEZI|nr:pre-mRNA processing factor 3-domain-containing protein [Phialemonium atrogriseum]KAK1772996.1 pre-mRNA processing factor 3-domain-containing protein [Phialemonium atrogriseum]